MDGGVTMGRPLRIVLRRQAARIAIQSRSVSRSRFCRRSNILPMSSAVQWRVRSRNFSLQLVPVERLLRRALEAGHRPPQHAAILQRDRDGCGKRRRAVVVDRNGHPLAQRPDPRVAQRRFVEGARVARVADMGERDAERDAVLRHHDVGGRGDVVDSRHLVVAGDVDRGDVGAVIAVLGPQIRIACTEVCAVMWQGKRLSMIERVA